MNFYEIVAAVEAHKQAIADMQTRYPKGTTRQGPSGVDGGCNGIRASIEDTPSAYKISIGFSALGSSTITLTVGQCEWLRDVLMEWFPKEKS